MKIKKVAFLVNEFPTLTETFILNQIIFLIANGVDVRIYSLYRGNFENLHQQYHGYGLEERFTIVGELPRSWPLRLKEVWGNYKTSNFRHFFWSLFQCTNPFKFGISGLKFTYFLYYFRMSGLKSADLIHAHFGHMGCFFAKFKSIGLFENVPYLVSFHGFDLIPSLCNENRILYKEMFKTANLFTVNSLYTGQLLKDVEPLIEGKIELLPESLDTRLFERDSIHEFSKNDQKYELVFVGRLVDWKGPDTAIRIVQKLVKELEFKNLKLSIIGSGPMLTELEELVESLEMSSHIKLLGARSQIQIRSILAISDIFLYTGREEKETRRAENQGLVLMEAQAMGLPVIAFDVGGVREGILNNETGILIQKGDIKKFVLQTAQLLVESKRRYAMGIAAREYVAGKYDIEILGKKLVNIYDKMPL